MSNNLFLAGGCVSEETFSKAVNDLLSEQEWGLITNHVRECSFCSDALDGLLQAENFDESTDEIRTSISEKANSHQFVTSRRSLFYSLSAAASVIIFLGLYLLVQINDNSNLISSNSTNFERPVPQVDGDNILNTGHSEEINSKLKIFQPGSSEETDLFENRIFNFTEEMPEFPGGIVELDEFIRKEVKEAEIKYGVRACGQILVGFLINSKGEVENPVILKGASKELNRIAVSIIEKLPEWKPGYQSGEAVNVAYALPVRFDRC